MRKAITAIAIGIVTLVAAPSAIAVDSHDQFVSEASPRRTSLAPRSRSLQAFGVFSPANKICKRADRKAKRIAPRVPPGDDRFAEKLKELALFNKLLAKTIRQLDAIGPAPGFEGPVDAWLDGLRLQKRLVDRYIGSVKRGRHADPNPIACNGIEFPRRLDIY